MATAGTNGKAGAKAAWGRIATWRVPQNPTCKYGAMRDTAKVPHSESHRCSNLISWRSVDMHSESHSHGVKPQQNGPYHPTPAHSCSHPPVIGLNMELILQAVYDLAHHTSNHNKTPACHCATAPPQNRVAPVLSTSTCIPPTQPRRPTAGHPHAARPAYHAHPLTASPLPSSQTPAHLTTPNQPPNTALMTLAVPAPGRPAPPPWAPTAA